MKKLFRKLSRIRNRAERFLYVKITGSWLWQNNSAVRWILLKIKKILAPTFARRIDTYQVRIEQVTHSIYHYGFEERGVADLQSMAEQEEKKSQRRLISWQLALYYANQNTKEGARKCLELLPEAAKGETHEKRFRQIAVLKAECLQVLGDVEAAKAVLSQALQPQPNINLYLCMANLEISLPKRLEWINKALQLYKIAPVSLNPSADGSLYMRLIPDHPVPQPVQLAEDDPLVSVIVPAYNCAGTIHMALDSLLTQTWSKLEILVVDDCSRDATAEVVEEYARRDPRIHVVRAGKNGGTYVARNLGLREATGDLVTCHDSDDWSHPQKIERQIQRLLQTPSMMANTSQMVRVTPNLSFYRRGKPGVYMMANTSSLLFRRVPVMESIGYWDSVRFAADTELQKRMAKVFGERSLIDLETGPLSFTLLSDDSLTRNDAFGFHGHRMGARMEYFDAYISHQASAEALRYDFPQTSRPFPVPEPFWPVREEKPSGRRHFDAVLVSDFRLQNSVATANIEEIKALKQIGLRTGLVQMSLYDLDGDVVDARIRNLLDGDRVQMLVYGEKISCDLLLLRHPAILQEWQRFIPDVAAQNVHVIMDQPPKRNYTDGETSYDINRCLVHLQKHFGKAGIWHPADALVREMLKAHHSGELAAITLADEDWGNIIDVGEWRRAEGPVPGPKIRIGRYSADHSDQWPTEARVLRAIYPTSGNYEVHLLGSGKVAKKTLRRLPKNWLTWGLGKINPKDFLAELDAFIYFTNPDLAESPMREIIEAMAVGVPVILPYRFQGMFQDAAVYASPAEVKEKIGHIMKDEEAYATQVEKAYNYVTENCEYSRHIERLKRLLCS